MQQEQLVQNKIDKMFYTKNHSLAIDVKILVGGHKGFIKYIGPLLHQLNQKQNNENQLWVGIQWDDIHRGKHNGTINGFKYFQTENNQNTGSLVKLKKVQFGQIIIEAFLAKYFKNEEINVARNLYKELTELKKKYHIQQQKNKMKQQIIRKAPTIEYDNDAYFQTFKKTKKMVQFIGFDRIWEKIHNLDQIKQISLSNLHIQDIGKPYFLRNQFPKLKILSLQNNMLFSWHQIFLIGLQLINLQQLSISYNILNKPQNFNQNSKIIVFPQKTQSNFKIKGIFSNLKTLILISMRMSWLFLMRVLFAFPFLQQLMLCKNDMSDTENILDLQQLKSLKLLNLQQTNLTNFQGLKVFQNKKHLTSLILNNNHIKQFPSFEGFESLTYLSLQNNLIEDPFVISQIAQFKNLQKLNLKHNVIASKFGSKYARQRCFAEMPKLNVIILNSFITGLT